MKREKKFASEEAAKKNENIIENAVTFLVPMALYISTKN